MILEDQVSLLRQNINKIRKKDFVLPLMGGEVFTKQAYEFKHLIHPARDIATVITTSDPGSNKLPKHLRGWDLDVKRGYGDEEKIKKLKFNKILGSLWIAGRCSQNAFNEAFQERFAPFSHVMNELKKAQIEWEFFLRDPSVGSQPRA